MSATLQFVIVFIAGAASVGLLLTSTLGWRAWQSALATAIIAVVIGALFDPIELRIGNAIAAFLPAFAGAALGSFRQRKRTV